MENTVDKNAEALEKMSHVLGSFAFDHYDVESSNRVLWNMFEDSFAGRENDICPPDIDQRLFIYDSLRLIFNELEKIKFKGDHQFKITYEPVTPSQS